MNVRFLELQSQLLLLLLLVKCRLFFRCKSGCQDKDQILDFHPLYVTFSWNRSFKQDGWGHLVQSERCGVLIRKWHTVCVVVHYLYCDFFKTYLKFLPYLINSTFKLFWKLNPFLVWRLFSSCSKQRPACIMRTEALPDWGFRPKERWRRWPMKGTALTPEMGTLPVKHQKHQRSYYLW